MRYLGLAWKIAKQRHVQQLFAAEMLARSAKNIYY